MPRAAPRHLAALSATAATAATAAPAAPADPGPHAASRRHVLELDGIRALAVLAVFVSHVGWAPLSGGWIGVGVFFVLSGYLITSILIGESQASGGIRLRRFYVRRLLRLYPAMLLMLAMCAPFAPLFGDGGTAAGYILSAAATAFYVQDFVLGLTGDAHGLFLHTWSLAVEEQFYLVWPPVLIALLKRGRNPLTWALSGVAISWTLLALTTRTNGEHSPSTYALPHTRAGELMLGCALAIWLSRARSTSGSASVSSTADLLRRACAPASLLILGAMLLTAGEAGLSSWMPLQIMLTAAASVVLIAGLVTRPVTDTDPLARLLRMRQLVWLGSISYGFYLFHLPAMQILERYGPSSWPVRIVLAFVISLAVAAASHRFVERPFLALRDRPPRGAGRPAVAAVR